MIIKKLGHGASSVVKLGQDANTGEFFALKFLKNSIDKLITTELEFFENMPAHQNILTFHGCKSGTYVKKYSGKESERTYFQLEFAMRGELFDYLIGCGPFPEPIARFFFREIISAIDHIHSNGISHRDIKPENIFIAGDYHVKVADFGFSIAITGRDGSGLLRTYKGTRPYMAPELAARMEYTGVAVDLFAAGIICFIMVTGRPPFMRAEPNNPHYMPIIDGNW